MFVQDSGLTTAFDIDEGKLACFLKRIEAGYRDNPYHNRQARQLWDMIQVQTRLLFVRMRLAGLNV